MGAVAVRPEIPVGPFTFEPRVAAPPPTPRPDLDRAVQDVAGRRRAWVATPVSERIRLLDEIRRGIAAVADEWTAVALDAEGIDPASPTAAEEATAGPYLTLRNVRLLRESLVDIERGGVPRIPGAATTRADGTVVAPVFPADPFDASLFLGVRAEAWMQPGVEAEGLEATMARQYRSPDEGAVCVVLGAGNVTGIGPMDALYKLFVENRVTVLKTHPVLAHVGPSLEVALRPLIDGGFLRIVHGAAAEGAQLINNPLVDEAHITGSSRTYDAIVFGPGSAGDEAKRRGEPILHKPVSAELGSVTPIVIVPGRWSSSDLDYHADNVAAMLLNNAGFNCMTARVLVTHAAWPQREAFLDALRRQLAASPSRLGYYPGAADRWEAFRAGHKTAELFGEHGDGRLPWLLIPSLDPNDADEPCFTTEAFCSLVAEAPLQAPDAAGFIDRSVGFCNERLWGTLSATVIVPPFARRDDTVRVALERAERDLRYGTISFNHWSAVGYALASPPWGAHPGHTASDIGSGSGVVHNTFMFERPLKTIVRAPFKPWPKPFWFGSHRRARQVANRLVRFETRRTVGQLPGLFVNALRG